MFMCNIYPRNRLNTEVVILELHLPIFLPLNFGVSFKIILVQLSKRSLYLDALLFQWFPFKHPHLIWRKFITFRGGFVYLIGENNFKIIICIGILNKQKNEKRIKVQFFISTKQPSSLACFKFIAVNIFHVLYIEDGSWFKRNQLSPDWSKGSKYIFNFDIQSCAP